MLLFSSSGHSHREEALKEQPEVPGPGSDVGVPTPKHLPQHSTSKALELIGEFARSFLTVLGQTWFRGLLSANLNH